MSDLMERLAERFKRNRHVVIIGTLVFLFMFAYLYQNIVITVQPGEAAVYYRRFFGGTVLDRVYGEGVHFIPPWDKMYIYNVRVQQASHEFQVLTKSGMKVNLVISIRYYPEYDLVAVLHQRVGPDYAKKVVIPEIESVLRIIIGKLDATEVYTTKTSLIENALNEGIEQVAQRFIKIDDVIIKRIGLPAKVEEAIQNKIEQKHLAEAHVYKIEREIREAERKRIEAAGLRDYNKIVNSSLSPEIIRWKGIEATLKLAESDNSKVVLVGSSADGLPLIGNIPLDSAPQRGEVPGEVVKFSDQ